jgi:hypothetical protein
MSSSPSAVYDNKRFIERGSHKGKGLAVFTSGGDSQGMVVLYLLIRACNCGAKIMGKTGQVIIIMYN